MKQQTAHHSVSSIFKSNSSMRLYYRNDIHWARKLWHLGMGCLIVGLYMLGVPQGSAVLLLGLYLIFQVIMERQRLRIPALNQLVMRFWGPIMRSHERHGMSTVPHYVAATMIAIAVFPKPVAVLSILYLACGDPIASIFGILYGHCGPRLVRGKTLIGTLAGFVTCFLITFVYALKQPLAPAHKVALSFVGGLAGGLSELIPLEIDDNFVIPVISGFLLWLAFIVLGC